MIMPRGAEHKGKSPEVIALNNFLDLGRVAMHASRTLEDSLTLLENTGRIVAPEGSFLVLQPARYHHDLVIEKFEPDQGGGKGRYMQHFMDPIDEIPGVRLLDRQELYYGKFIEYDREAKGFYVYYQTGESRALHRVDDEKTEVSIRTFQWMSEL